MVIKNDQKYFINDPNEIIGLRWWPLDQLPPDETTNKVLKVASKKLKHCFNNVNTSKSNVTTITTTPTNSPTYTPTNTPSITASVTPSVTPTESLTPTTTPTPTDTG